MRRLLAGAVSIGLAAGAIPAAGAGSDYAVLVFTKTTGYRHESIPAGVQAIRDLGAAHGFTVTEAPDASAFTADNLARYRAVVFLSTSGDVLDVHQQAAFEAYIRTGGGFVGVHAAADTEYDWPFYGRLVGAWFAGHPEIQRADAHVTNRAHPATAHLPRVWTRTDELYNYRTNPRSAVQVLATLDESSYTGGTMGADHPIAWCHTVDRGRAFYTGFGHTAASYTEPDFRSHLLGGIRYAAARAHADCRPETGYAALTDGWRQAGPGSFTITDGTFSSVGGMGLLWYATRPFTDYAVKADWRVTDDSNSGIFVGFPDPGDDPWVAVNQGYEIQIDASDAPDRTTGAIYGFQAADRAARDAVLNPPGEWNTFEIRVEGPRLRVYLNGVLINDFTGTDPARGLDGHLGLQNHGPADQVAFRNIRVAELPACGRR
ncbi:ThuA domain-containing protein [Paractinoplanes rishiriensis]|uniref:Glycosyl hydrolase n=1 Tax=Paractinoplanes rishiriensis TaxID=1050105 RepID=A0A919N0Y0_9ACTN|nr:hypothetical protein Ari01nite_31420 [Actinoplanes rishiriensis]